MGSTRVINYPPSTKSSTCFTECALIILEPRQVVGIGIQFHTGRQLRLDRVAILERKTEEFIRIDCREIVHYFPTGGRPAYIKENNLRYYFNIKLRRDLLEDVTVAVDAETEIEATELVGDVNNYKEYLTTDYTILDLSILDKECITSDGDKELA